MDLAAACREEIELQQVAWPDNPVEIAVDGPTQGLWDASRLKQVLGNLIANPRRSSFAWRASTTGSR